jgi:endonuclease/exonuclease/phosphatase family metal-dependent hydrolase
MNVVARAGSLLLPGVLFASFNLSGQTPVVTQTNATVRIMAANLTSGTSMSYEAPGIRIFQGLEPDVVAIQEFRYNSSTSDAQLRQLVNTAFGPSFYYYREVGSYNIPNGIVSRWPILSSGTWEDVDPNLNDRGFAWAKIDLPGTNDLYVVSIHLKASSGSSNASRRDAEATNLVNLIHANFPANAWIIVAGDCNIHDPSEGAYLCLSTNFSDSPIPTDAEIGGDADTNEPRSARYDYVFPSQNFSNLLVSTVYGANIFPKGLVFDSAVYSPLSDVSPVQSGDSHVTGMQHMGVIRTFNVPYYVTNYVTNPPSIALDPQSQTVPQGSDVTFTVTADGTPPLAYQWRFNSAVIAGATASAWTRSNVQPADMGSYSVVVSNAAGTATSSNATLSLIVPPPALVIQSPQVLQWQGLSNLVYRVQARTNLQETNWFTVGTASAPTASLSFTNPADAPQRFYRVVYP